MNNLTFDTLQKRAREGESLRVTLGLSAVARHKVILIQCLLC